ncbi:hypothetical protein [Cellulophaga tyrosinoxydans]|nr:hypothetical protein [Cellulophaga tyrosinoxydans]
MENMYTGKGSRNPNTHLISGLLIGLALIAFGIYMYFDLAAWENSTEQKSLNSLLWFIYDMTGKIGVAGFFSSIGALLIVNGYLKTKSEKTIIAEQKNSSENKL